MMQYNDVEISIHGKWVAVPALKVNAAEIVFTGKWLRMAALRDEEYLERELEDPGFYIQRLKEQRSRRFRADIFTFAQAIPNTTPKFPYPFEWDSIAAVRTTSFEEWWTRLPQESRKNVRRAEKRGVTLIVKGFDDHLARGIVDLNNDSALRQGKRFVHYGKTLDQVRKDQSAFPDRSDYVCAYFGDELIGFLKIAYRGAVASLVQILSKASQNDKRPANALLAKAVELSEAKGISYLTYGYFNYGNKQDSPLRQFKVRNGFEEILTPRYYVPLTAWGRECARLKLYRGAFGIIPYSILRVGVNGRAKLYQCLEAVKSRRSLTAEQSIRNRQVECSKPPAGSNV